MEEKYEELENIVNTLGSLADEITDKYYLDMINELKYEAQTELNEISEQLYKLEKEEQQELEYEFDRERL